MKCVDPCQVYTIVNIVVLFFLLIARFLEMKNRISRFFLLILTMIEIFLKKELLKVKEINNLWELNLYAGEWWKRCKG